MFEYIRARRTTPTSQARTPARAALTLCGAALLLAGSLSACSDKQQQASNADASALKSDPALSRDLALAAADTSAKPKLQDVPEPAATPVRVPPPAPAPRPTPKPKPRPARVPSPSPTPSPTPTPVPAPAAAPMTGVVAAGTSLSFAANQKVCSNTSHAGDKFTADLTQSVGASNSMSIPAGATGTFEVVRARTAANGNDSTVLIVRLLSVQYGGRSYAVESTVQSASTNRIRSASTATDAKKVAGGAILGGILGQIIGKNTKGTVIGAAAGAAAGTAAAAATADYDTCLNSGAAVTVRLDAPTTIRAANP
jgi:outer membrane biosynthesis protein TonB